MAAVEIRSDLLDLSAMDRAMCCVVMQWEMSVAGLSPERPSTWWCLG